MVKKYHIAAALVLLLLLCGSVMAEERLKVIPASGIISSLVTPPTKETKKTITLDEAKARPADINPINDSDSFSSPDNDRADTQDDNSIIPDLGVSEGIRSGLNAFLIDIANDMFEIVFGKAPNKQILEQYGIGEATVYMVATSDLNPYDMQSIQNIRKDSAMIGFFAFLCALILTGIKVNLSAATHGAIDRVLYTVTETVSTFGKFRDDILIGIGGIIGIHYILKFIVMMNIAMTQGILTSSMKYIPLDLNNIVLYFIMAVCYLLESFFYIMRFEIMASIAAADIILGGLFAFPSMRGFVISVIKYFTKLTFLQFTVCFITFIGMAVIDDLPAGRPLACICLSAIVIGVSAVIVYGFTNVFRTAKLAVRYAL